MLFLNDRYCPKATADTKVYQGCHDIIMIFCGTLSANSYLLRLNDLKVNIKTDQKMNEAFLYHI